MIGIILEGSMLFSRIGIFWSKKTHYFLIVQILGLLLVLSFNFLLTKHIGIFGAVFSLLISRFFMNLLYFKISSKYYFVKYKFKQIALVFLLSLLVCFTVLFNYYHPDFYSYVLKYLSLLLFFILSFFIGFDNEERRNLKKK